MLIEVFKYDRDHTLVINGFRIAGPHVFGTKPIVAWNVDRDVFTNTIMRALKVANADGSYT